MPLSYHARAALALHNRQWSVIPLPPGSKSPGRNGWQDERHTADDIPRLFNGACNIGVLLGEASGWLVDIDLDHPLAVKLAPQFLPQTDAIFGRASKQRSHFLYIAKGAETHQRRFKGGPCKKEMIVELRSTGAQTVFPGSVHESGERIEWAENGEPAEVDAAELLAAVAALADEVERQLGAAPDTLNSNDQQQTRYSDPDAIERCRKYVNKMPEAISEQGGHPATFAVACVIYRFGLNDFDAAKLLGEYNERCQPPWSERELIHKLADAKAEVEAKGEFGSLCKKKKSADEPGLVKDLADGVIGSGNRFARDKAERLFHFDNGVYKPGGGEFVKQQVREFCDTWKKTKYWSPKVAAHVAEYLRLGAPRLWERPPLDVVNVQNGLLDVVSKKLRPHDPAHLSPVQLPVQYDPEATCPAIEDFVGKAFPADANSLAWEIVAWLMLPNTSIQKSVLFTGPSGNGKSVYLRMLQAFLGLENVSAVSLHDLVTDKFAPANLYGRLANICGDLSREELPDVSVFKRFTGGDLVTAQHKHGHLFQFIPFNRFVFSANEIPKSKDTTPAYLDRWLILRFPNSFRGQANEIPREVLDARLAAPSELSGLLNNALQCLPLTKLSEPESVRDATRRWRASAGDVKAELEGFLAEGTHQGPDLMVSKEALRNAFHFYRNCRSDKPVAIMTESTFGTLFGKLRPDIQVARRMYKGKPRQHVYLGVALR